MKRKTPIKNKKKKCKGNENARGAGCGEEKYIKRYGLCEPCYKKWLIETPEGRERLKKSIIKVQAPRIKAKQELEIAFEQKKTRKKLQQLLLDTRAAVHRYIRERDKGKPCISCGTQWSPSFQAGHYFKAELYSGVKFDYDNIHGQCAQCNTRKEGNINMYSERLPKRIGEKDFQELISRAEKYRQNEKNFKWDIEELEKIKKQAQIDWKNLKNV